MISCHLLTKCCNKVIILIVDVINIQFTKIIELQKKKNIKK